MILYDPALNMNFRDYGIMLPIAPDRGKQILEFMGKHYYPGARGDSFPYPGPVLDINDALQFLDIRENQVITREDLERVHSKDYISSLYGRELETSLLTTFELIDKEGRYNRYEPERAVRPIKDLFNTILAQISGTYLSCRLALAEGPGFCYFIGGGMHHARYDSGAGFCLLNDSAIAIAKILSEPNLAFSKTTAEPLIWIIDLDVHKGDGTAELINFARRSGKLQNVLTLSIHMAKGWPLDTESLTFARKDRAPLIPSDIDIGIEEGEETTYTPRLAEGIRELERLSLELYPKAAKPDLVLVVDGADPYEHDELPSSCLLKLNLEQCLERDTLIYRYVMDRAIPSAWILSGGYGDRAWEPPAHFLMTIR